MIQYTKDLFITAGSMPPVIKISQYSDDFTIVFNLIEIEGVFALESGTTAEIRGTKTDGNGYSADAAIDIANKTVTVSGHKQMTAAQGKNVFEIVLWKGEKELATANFVLLVEPAAMDAETVPSETIIKEIGEAVDEAVDEYFATHDIVIDPTLSISGRPADAKATGDAVVGLKDGLSDDDGNIIPSQFLRDMLLNKIDAVASETVNQLKLSLKTEGKLYSRNNDISIIIDNNNGCLIYSPVRILSETTYYYRNIYGYFTKIVYDDGTYDYLKADTYAYAAGNIKPEKNGYVYVTARLDATGIVLWTDSEYLYSAKDDGWFTPNLLKTLFVYPPIVVDDSVLDDANKVVTSSVYRIQLSGKAPLHFPSDIASGTWLFVSLASLSHDNRNTLQYLYNYQRQRFMYQRNGYNNNTTWSEWSPMQVAPMTFYVGASEEFKRLRDGIAKAVQFKDSKVIVRAGTYDLISEFSEEINASKNENFGIILENGVHVIFDPGAAVVANYTGNDTNILNNFSPFLSGHVGGGFTLENLTISTKNTRYCVHDDLGDYDIISTNKFINCKMTHDDTENTVKSYPQCIGGGFGRHTYVVINNCYFRSVGSDNYPNPIVSYHNTWKFNDAKSKLILSNSYFYGKGTYRCSHHGPSSLVSESYINNCSLGSQPIIKHEVSGSTNPENTSIVSYMNEIRA